MKRESYRDPVFQKALRSVIRDRLTKKALEHKDILAKTSLSLDFISKLLEGNEEIHRDYVTPIATALSVSPKFLVSMARKVATSEKRKASSKKPKRNGVHTAYEIAQLSGKTLGLKFISKNDPVVNRTNPDELKKVKEQRKRRVESRVVLNSPR
jgi:cyanate lyase